MMLFCKLYQPLKSCSYRFYRSTHVLKHISNAKQIIPLITKNADIYEKMIGNLSTIEWKDIREKVLQRNEKITPVSVDSIIMDMCLNDFHVDNAIAYFKFLRENNYSLNIAIIGKYLRLYVLKQESLTDADKIEIVNTYNALRQKHPYLDSITVGQCIQSLCLTDEWEKAYELIEMLKITVTPGTTIYSALASAAFRNGKPDVAWKTLSNIILRKLMPQNTVYTSHLQYCQLENANVFNSRMEEMFNFLAKYNVIPHKQIISTYADTSSKYGWSTKVVTISRKMGHCEHCGYSLPKITFNEKEFQELKQFVIDRIIIGSDIYLKTNPKELLKFKKFIENTQPYDIVIDGLNISYSQSGSLPKLQSLIDVIEYFKKHGKKVLVLTRKHQRNLSAFKYVERNALVFLTDNVSADDPYLLYATMAKGMNTMFVSSDFMRQHKHSLQDERVKQNFIKWQYSHQYFVRKSATGFRIQEPFAYMPTAQKSGNCWHIPCITENFTNTESYYEFSDKWYCLKHNESRIYKI